MTEIIQNGNEPRKARHLSRISKQDFQIFVENLDAVMFDCDGVLWLAWEPIPNAQALIIKLRSLGKKIFFITNNSTNTREELLVKFNNIGFQANVDEIIATSYLAAVHLKKLGFSKKVYVIGQPSIAKELANVGIQSLPTGADNVPPTMEKWSPKHFENPELDSEVGAVVVGCDHHFSFLKILKAANYIVKQKCLFIATNPDFTIPCHGGFIPETGPLVKAVETASGHKPTIVGKPATFPFDQVSRVHQLNPSRVLMVGDRGNTDILFGHKCGLWTLLVLSGVTNLNEMHRWENSENLDEKQFIPHYYLENVNEFFKLLSQM